MKIISRFACINWYVTGGILMLLAGIGWLGNTAAPTNSWLPSVLLYYTTATYVAYLGLGTAVLLYLHFSSIARTLASLLCLFALLRLYFHFVPNTQPSQLAIWLNWHLYDSHSHIGSTCLFAITAALLVFPPPSNPPWRSFLYQTALALGLCSASIVMLAYSWLTTYPLLSLPAGMICAWTGLSMALLAYQHYTVEGTMNWPALKRAQQQRTLLAQSAIGIWELDLITQQLRMDLQTTALYGLNPANAPFTLTDWFGVIAPDDLPTVQQAITKCQNTQQPIDLCFRINTHTDTPRYLRTRAQHLHSIGLTSNILLGISVDVTHETEQTLGLNQLNALLAKHAHYDSLTGLLNQYAFTDAATRYMADAQRSQIGMAGFFIDLDWFKAINDLHGHLIGDQVLIRVARRIRTTLRTGDIVCRLGGDEFFALLSHISDMHQAKCIARQLIEAVQKPMKINGLLLRVSISIGIALFPTNADNTDELIARADAAMRRAKQAGKGCCMFYGE